MREQQSFEPATEMLEENEVELNKGNYITLY